MTLRIGDDTGCALDTEGFEAGKMSSCENGRLSLMFRIPSQGEGCRPATKINLCPCFAEGKKVGGNGGRDTVSDKADVYATRRGQYSKMGSGRPEWITTTYLT